ncbi:S9 family peptidase, partial [bacterium]|nr:S9 family peptidase [candidate division CSSED10-310 bacterium]
GQAFTSSRYAPTRAPRHPALHRTGFATIPLVTVLHASLRDEREGGITVLHSHWRDAPMSERRIIPNDRPGLSSEDFYRIRHVDEARISPDGTRIAYVLETVNRAKNTYNRGIWIVPVDGGEPRKFTAGSAQDSSPRWSPDGSRLAFISTRAGKPQIFIISVDGGEAWQLTTLPNGAGAFTWSPDGARIAFISRLSDEERKKEGLPDEEPEDRFEQKMMDDRKQEEERRRKDPRVVTRLIFRRGQDYWDGRHSHVYIQDVKEGAKPQRLTDGDHDFGPPCFTRDGSSILTFANREGNVDVDVRSDLYVLPATGGDLVRLTSGPDGDFAPRPTPDGTSVVYLAFHADRLYEQRMSLRIIGIEGGESLDLTDETDLDVHAFSLTPAGDGILFLAGWHGEQRLYRYDFATGGTAPIVSGSRFIKDFHVSTVSGRLVYVVSAPDIPSDVFTAAPDGSDERRLTEVNREFLDTRTLSIPEEIWFESVQNARIQGWIMKPVGFEPGRKYPMLVEVHGGPHIMWGWEFWHEFQVFCAKGYVVYYSNPRGSEGYGRALKGSIRKNWGIEDRLDILGGIDQVAARGFVDTDRLVLTGGSFGGFMTATLVAADHRFKAAVAQRGVYNFISLYGNSDAMTLVEWEFETLPWEDTEMLWRFSPLSKVTDIQTPLMIIHSEQDYRAGIQTADELFVALRRLGKEVEFIRYPREGHELSRSGEPEHRVDRLDRIAGWFERHLPDLEPR